MPQTTWLLVVKSIYCAYRKERNKLKEKIKKNNKNILNFD